MTTAGGWALAPATAWGRPGRFDAGYREEYGPGASSHGFDGSVTWLPVPASRSMAYGSTLDRPLEFRFDEASVDAFGVEAEWSPTNQCASQVGGAQYCEIRDRPDAAAFDWDQTRLHARVTLLLRSGPTPFRLPPALGPVLGREPVRARARLLVLAVIGGRLASGTRRGMGGAGPLRPLAASRALPLLCRLPRGTAEDSSRLALAAAGELRRLPRRHHREGRWTGRRRPPRAPAICRSPTQSHAEEVTRAHGPIHAPVQRLPR